MKKIKRNKKGVIEIQFNWIFVIIAGVIIISFFFVLINNIVKNSKETQAIEISDQLNLIMSGGIVTQGKEANISTQGLVIEFMCDNDKNTFNVAQVAEEGYDAKDTIIFAPHMIDDLMMTYRTRAVDLPFRVSNILLVSSPNTKYYFIYESARRDFAEDIRDGMADNVDVEFVEEGNIDTLSFQKSPSIKFVYFTQVMGSFPSQFKEKLPKRLMSGLHIPDEDSAIFYDYDDRAGIFTVKKEVRIFSEELLLAAIYSADYDTFNCGFRRILDKWRMVARVYDKRSIDLVNDIGILCQGFHSSFNIMGNPAATITGELNEIIIDPATSDVYDAGTKYNVNSIQTFIDDLASQNYNAETSSCPVIY